MSLTNLVRQLLSPKTSAAAARLRRVRRRSAARHRPIFFESLESRTLLASVSDGGGTAVTFSLSTNEALAIVSNGTSYTFSTNQTFANGGVAAAASDFSAFGGASLTLRAPGLNRYVLISIVDTGTNASVTFNNSGASNYSDSFFVSLD